MEESVSIVMPEAKPAVLDPNTAILVLIDMENEFLHPDGKMYSGERSGPAVEHAATLLKKFRDAGGKVLFVRSVRDKDNLEFTVFHRPFHLLRNTWGSQIVDPLSPKAGEPIVEKHSHDCFNGTTMLAELDKLGAKPGETQIIVMGVDTGVCVDCAVIGFSVRDYHVYLAMDCACSSSEFFEWVAYQHFMRSAYNYNITLTRSDLVSWTKTPAKAKA